MVSLSGGADSSAVVFLVALTLQRAAKELGREELNARLSYLAKEPEVRSILTCAARPFE